MTAALRDVGVARQDFDQASPEFRRLAVGGTMTGLRGAKPRCDRHRHGASTPTGEHIFAAQSPSAATVPKTRSTYTSCLRSWRRTSRAWMPYEVDLAGTGHRSGGRPETAMGLHRSLVSRSPMYAVRAGSPLLMRCISSPPSQRISATMSPAGLRDKTCQYPPQTVAASSR